MKNAAFLFATMAVLVTWSGCFPRQPQTPEAQFQKRVEQFYKLYSEKNYEKMYSFLSPELRKVCPYDDFHEMLYWSEDTYILRNYTVEKITLNGDAAKALVRTTGFPPTQLIGVPTATRMDEYVWVRVDGRWYLKSWYITSLKDGEVYTVGQEETGEEPSAPAGPSPEVQEQ